MPSRSQREEDTAGKSDGHITAEMIKALFKENVDENQTSCAVDTEM